MAYTDFIRTRIFQPLGMDGTDLDFSRLPSMPDHTAIHQLDVLTGMQPIPFYRIGVDLPAAGVNRQRRGYGPLCGVPAHRHPGGRRSVACTTRAGRDARGSGADGRPWLTGEAATAVAEQRGLPAPEVLLHDPGYAFYWITGLFLDGYPMPLAQR
jgi:CubicO group peptidase (beta-lactamase class C family)